MDLRPIEDEGHDDALALLAEGFPVRSPAHWKRILERTAAFRDRSSRWPLGYVMSVRGEDAGVLVTTASSRTRSDGTAYEFVNLSSWYVRPSHRMLAMKMLKTVIGTQDAIFTDVTPIPSVRKLNAMLGFATENEAVRVYPMPFSALRPAGGARVVGANDGAWQEASPETRRIMDDHAALGCVTGWLKTGDGPAAPLVFCRTERRGIPGLRLVYGPGKATIARAGGAVSRFLATRPVLFWELNANRDDRLPGSVFWRGSPCQIRGSRESDAIDYAYSESVFAQA